MCTCINNLYPFEIVGRGSGTQLQMGNNSNYNVTLYIIALPGMKNSLEQTKGEKHIRCYYNTDIPVAECRAHYIEHRVDISRRISGTSGRILLITQR